jgi:hypothetical protein
MGVEIREFTVCFVTLPCDRNPPPLIFEQIVQSCLKIICNLRYANFSKVHISVTTAKHIEHMKNMYKL